MLLKPAMMISVAMPPSAYAKMQAPDEPPESDFMSAFDDKPAAPEPAPAAPEPAPAPVTEPAPAAPISTASAPAQPVVTAPPTTPAAITLKEVDDRIRLKQLEDENKALRDQAQPEFEIPDPKTDPEGYQEYTRQLSEIRIINERLNMSEVFARDKHGDKRIDEVQNWFIERAKADPPLFQRIMQSRNPYGEAIKEYDKEQLLQSLSDPAERAAYDEWKKQRAAVPPAPGGSPPVQQPTQPAAAAKPAAAQPQPPAAPLPTSIASMPGAGNGGNIAIPVGNGAAFDSIFN